MHGMNGLKEVTWNLINMDKRKSNAMRLLVSLVQ